MTELAILPESTTPVVAGDENVLRLRVLDRGIKVAGLEFAVRCKAEVDAGRKQYEVAEDVGCARSKVTYALQALDKIVKRHNVTPSDLDSADEYDAAMREVRSPENALPPGVDTKDIIDQYGPLPDDHPLLEDDSQWVESEPVPHDPATETIDAEFVDEVDPDFELPGRAERPLRDYGPEEALADNIVSFERLAKFTGRLDLPPHRKSEVRITLHEMVEREIQ